MCMCAFMKDPPEVTRKPMFVRNPRTGRADYEIKPLGSTEVAAHCAALRTAQSGWLALGLEGRIAVLNAFADAVASKGKALTDALVLDTGRSFISAMEVQSIAGSIKRWVNITRGVVPTPKRQSQALPFISFQSELQPYALVGVISPWNFPLTLSIIDALPALLAGCCVIIKPSEVTPRFAKPLRKIIAQIPALAEVLDIIDGDGETGAAVVDHVDSICFTGSVPTGRMVGERAAKNLIPAFLELGGKDPAIVLESADIERATTALLRGSILNAGQACQSVERIYVARPVFDEFINKLVQKAQKITLNTPNPSSGHLGPIIFEKQAAIIEAQINDAVEKGAAILTGGVIENHGGGLWCKPTIITGVTDDMTIMQQETFGPLLPVIAFDTVEEAVKRANNSDFGLSASVFAGSAEEAITVGRMIEAGGISINDASLTSLMYEAEKDSFKQSGLGASRMGLSGYLRFFRKQAFMVNEADVFTIDQFNEANAAQT